MPRSRETYIKQDDIIKISLARLAEHTPSYIPHKTCKNLLSVQPRPQPQTPRPMKRPNKRTFSSSPSFMLRAFQRASADRAAAPTLELVLLSQRVPKPHGLDRATGAPTKAAPDEEVCPVHAFASAVPAAAARIAQVLIMVGGLRQGDESGARETNNQNVGQQAGGKDEEGKASTHDTHTYLPLSIKHKAKYTCASRTFWAIETRGWGNICPLSPDIVCVLGACLYLGPPDLDPSFFLCPSMCDTRTAVTQQDGRVGHGVCVFSHILPPPRPSHRAV